MSNHLLDSYRHSHSDKDRGATYDQNYSYGGEHFYWNNFEKPYLEGLFKRLEQEYPGRLLDFATGTGRILQISAPHFSEVVGIDVSESMMAEAEKKVPNACFICADVTVSPPGIGVFSVVSMFRFVLNAEPDLREAVLHWIRSVITHDGILVLNNHCNKRSATGRICQLSNAIRHQKRHNILSDADIETLLRKCGFQIIDRWGFGLIPAWRNRLLLSEDSLFRVEHFLGQSQFLQTFSKDLIYLCRPT